MVFTLLLVLFQPAEAAPKFDDYSVKPVFTGTPAQPKFVPPGQRRFRTVVRDWAKGKPNFADHFTIASWGCGTGCIQMAVVDLISGDVFDGPFGSVDKSVLCLGANTERDKTGTFFQRASSLLYVRGCPDWRKCGDFYFNWTGSQFTLLRNVKIKPVFGCE